MQIIVYDGEFNVQMEAESSIYWIEGRRFSFYVGERSYSIIDKKIFGNNGFIFLTVNTDNTIIDVADHRFVLEPKGDWKEVDL